VFPLALLLALPWELQRWVRLPSLFVLPVCSV
jgi:hypothetical protein